MYSNILDLLQIKQRSNQSIDYILNQKQFQLDKLLTEQRHAKTWDLSSSIKQNTLKGLEQVLSVDIDITNKIEQIIGTKDHVYHQIEQLSSSFEEAILNRKKIYLYGCGATGRLAKQIETSFWRHFWIKVKSDEDIYNQINKNLDLDQIEDQLIGEITGGDRALISSLEGFEDLIEMGQLQLSDNEIKKGDLVIAISEGGETSSVIGTILAASNQYENDISVDDSSRKNLYFIYNNPTEILNSFDRCRKVLENSRITKISLFTGPQAIAGSTRMQASTISTFCIGIALENALDNVLRRFISEYQIKLLGFCVSKLSLSERLKSFALMQNSVFEVRNSIVKLIDIESECYSDGNYSFYFAQNALMNVFTDATERSPTFNLAPLDTNELTKDRKSWIQVWTIAKCLSSAWKNLLGREFKGLNSDKYLDSFNKIENLYLRSAAIKSLKQADFNQQFLYDLACSEFNINNRGPKQNDLGVMVLLQNELHQISKFQNWMSLLKHNKAKLAIILVVLEQLQKDDLILQNINTIFPNALVIQLPTNFIYDPLGVRQHVCLKMLLNSHSTSVMAKLGRVVYNTMTNVRPGNLKLIGRATYLILSHVNDKLSKTNWSNKQIITYEDANAVLFDLIEYSESNDIDQSKVALCIVLILETFRQGRTLKWCQAIEVLKNNTLEQYLSLLI